MGAKQSIFSEYKSFFVDFLDRRGEVGGFLNTKTGELKHTISAKGLHIKAQEEYPQSSGIIAWHTHPQSSEDKARKEGAKYPLVATPSQLDIESALRLSLHYKEPTLNVVISKVGIFMYKPSKTLLTLLLEHSPAKQDELIKTIVIPNVITAQTLVSETPTNQIKLYQKEMKGLLTGKDGGFETHFAPW